MKKSFFDLEVEIIKFGAEDIITTSPASKEDQENIETEEPEM